MRPDRMDHERFYRDTLRAVRPEWRAELKAIITAAESRRPQAAYNTGTISEAACLYLRALCERLNPTTVIEIGTFIGTSTMTLALGALEVYTCDKDNDCLPSSPVVHCFPKQTSTDMLTALVTRQVRADLFFFDGRIQMEDIPLILALSKPATVYAFDDHERGEKGVVNVRRFWQKLRNYRLIPPPPRVLDLTSTTTIGVLEPAA